MKALESEGKGKRERASLNAHAHKFHGYFAYLFAIKCYCKQVNR